MAVRAHPEQDVVEPYAAQELVVLPRRLLARRARRGSAAPRAAGPRASRAASRARDGSSSARPPAARSARRPTRARRALQSGSRSAASSYARPGELPPVSTSELARARARDQLVRDHRRHLLGVRAAHRARRRRASLLPRRELARPPSPLITDYFDGYLARAQGQISRLGQFLDPIADKIMVAAVLIMLISSRKANPRAGDRRTAHHPGAGHPAARDHRLGPSRIPRASSMSRCRSARSPSGRRRFQLVALGALILGGAVPDAAVGPHGRARQPVGGGGADPGHRLRLSAHRPQAHGLNGERD